MHRQRIQHFVGDDHTFELFRQCVQPFHAICQFRQVVRNGGLLAVSQLRAHLQNKITRRQAVDAVQFAE